MPGVLLSVFSSKRLEEGVLHRERARQRLVRVDVGRDRLDAGRRAAADDRDRRRRRDRELVEKRAITPRSSASGQAPRSFASFTEAASAPRRRCLNITLFQAFAVADSIATPCAAGRSGSPSGQDRPSARACAE